MEMSPYEQGVALAPPDYGILTIYMLRFNPMVIEGSVRLILVLMPNHGMTRLLTGLLLIKGGPK